MAPRKKPTSAKKARNKKYYAQKVSKKVPINKNLSTSNKKKVLIHNIESLKANSYQKSYYQKNKLKILEKRKLDYNSNKNIESLKEKIYQKRYYQEKKSKILEKKREKYHLMTSLDKGNLCKENKQKYRMLSAPQKQKLSQSNKQKYKSLPPDKKQEKIQLSLNRHNNLVFSEYLSQIQDGPTEICVCCGALCFPKQVKYLSFIEIQKKFSDDFVDSVYCVNELNIGNNSKFCSTCHRYVQNGKVPPLCLSNGLEFPKVPDCLKKLSTVEEPFCALRIPFMQIKSLGHERQCGLKGQVVNVPIPVNTIVNALPRSLNETYTVQLHLKRKMSFNHDYMCASFRPGLVLKAFQYLRRTPLYQEYDVTLSDDWKQYEACDENDTELFIVSNDDVPTALDIMKDVQFKSKQFTIKESDNCGCDETLLNAPPIESVTMAPGEGQVPLSLLLDKDADELSFPCIFCGVKREFKVKLTYNQIVKSAIKHYNRKCTRVDVMFFMYKKLELLNLSQRISVCLRKKCLKNHDLTASQMLDDNFIDFSMMMDSNYLKLFPVHRRIGKRKGKKFEP